MIGSSSCGYVKARVCNGGIFTCDVCDGMRRGFWSIVGWDSDCMGVTKGGYCVKCAGGDLFLIGIVGVVARLLLEASVLESMLLVDELIGLILGFVMDVALLVA